MSSADDRRQGSVLLSCKWKDGSARLPMLTESSTLSDLKRVVSLATNYHRDRLLIKVGFPPTPINASAGDSLLALGVRSGSTIVVEDAGPPSPQGPPRDGARATDEATMVSAERALGDSRPSSNPEEGGDRSAHRCGRLFRKEVPKDDSCFFSSVSFCLRYRVGAPSSPAELRDDVAAVILSGHGAYDAAILGKPPEEYAYWIKRPTAWGGAIEAAILAEMYKIEIDVVDIETCTLQQFGQQANYDSRILLLYDGGHYEPLYRDLHDTSADSLQSVFARDDDAVLCEAQCIAQDARAAGQYVTANMRQLRLRCSQCGTRCYGPAGASDHSRATGHSSFEQIES